MIRSIIFAALVTMTAPFAFANQVEENYKICSTSETWMARFGRYIVAYDLRQAADICYAKAFPQRNVGAKQAGCKIHGEFEIAGWYCQSL